VGREKISIEEFRNIIEQKDRCKAGTSVPAQGLFLTEVNYPQEIFDF
jgi:tRNA pseudouridine38-40 synthase